jgi:hypothetical protein
MLLNLYIQYLLNNMLFYASTCKILALLFCIWEVLGSDQPRDKLFWLKFFMVFLSLSSQMPE